MIKRPFPAYEGDQPYFFVSYAHSDAEAVYSEMSWIRQSGFNLWYDDGIHIGTAWRRALAEALLGSSGLIFFCTPNSVTSDYCLREIHLALDERLPMLNVELKPSELPPELRLSISDRQALVKSNHEERSYKKKLCTALDSFLNGAARSHPAGPSRDKNGIQDELIRQRHSRRSQRIMLCAVAAFEITDTTPDDLQEQMAKAGGEVLQLAGNIAIVIFDAADKAMALLRESKNIVRAGMSCGDVHFHHGMAHGAPVAEAQDLLKASRTNEALINERLALLAGMETSSLEKVSGPESNMPQLPHAGTFSIGLFQS